jgi:hypothetical protein
VDQDYRINIRLLKGKKNKTTVFYNMDFQGFSLLAAAATNGTGGGTVPAISITTGEGLSSQPPIITSSGSIRLSDGTLQTLQSLTSKTQNIQAGFNLTQIGGTLTVQDVRYNIQGQDFQSVPVLLTATDNVVAGVQTGGFDGGLRNILFGRAVLPAISTGASENVCVGNDIGKASGLVNQNIISGSSNVLIGSTIVTAQQGLLQSVCVGSNSRVSSQSCNLGFNTITDAANSVALGFQNRNLARNCVSIGSGISVSALDADHTVIGNSTAVTMRSDSDSKCDLGTAAKRYKDLYLGGNINGLTVTGGKYSQTSTPVLVTGNQASTMLGTGEGSLVFQSLRTGDNYHFRFSGDIQNDVNNNSVRFRILLGTVVIHETVIILLELTGSNSLYAWEIEMDATAKANSTLSSNSQFLYSAGSDSRDLRGSNSNTNTSLDFNVPRTLTATAQFTTSGGGTRLFVNQALITKTY